MSDELRPVVVKDRSGQTWVWDPRTMMMRCAAKGHAGHECRCGGRTPSPINVWDGIRRIRQAQSSTPSAAELRGRLERIDGKMAELIARTTSVSTKKRELARQWTDAAAGYWGVLSPRIEWGVSSMKAGGEFDPSTPDRIYLAPTVAMRDLPTIAIHETTHYARYWWGLAVGDERGVERDVAFLLAKLG